METKVNPVEPANVKVGDLMAFVYYTRVKNSDTRQEKLVVEDVYNGKEFSVFGNQLISSSFSADQFSEEIKVTKTKAAEILVGSVNRPFSVSFDKADGSERVLRGKLVAPEPLLGRSMVEDLDLAASEKNRLRQVDHRTINWIIVEGVKYTVK
jgi:hypothetical protein